MELARELAGQRVSLRKISAALAGKGHVTAKGKPYVASAVRAMLLVESCGDKKTAPVRARVC